MTFKELNLSAPLLRAVQEAGYETPSPIQAAAIPPVLSGRDLMGCAQTGTGKTAAFALPMLDRLTANAPRKKGAIRALILTPTRELALQIGESFDAYGKYLKLRSTVIFGGVGQAPQVEALKKGVDILIACPGRLNDLIGQGFIDLSNLEIFVLDEADRMLDMGFVHDVKKVIAKLPGERQNLMFSATMPTEIEQLAAGILRKPAFVKVDPVSSTVDRIQQSLYHVEKGNKKFLLPWLIKNLQPPVVNALVFSRTKHGADKIAKDLTKQGIPAAAIHGNKSQTARVTALENFKAGKTKVLVATDIAATRGTACPRRCARSRRCAAKSPRQPPLNRQKSLPQSSRSPQRPKQKTQNLKKRLHPHPRCRQSPQKPKKRNHSWMIPSVLPADAAMTAVPIITAARAGSRTLLPAAAMRSPSLTRIL